MGEKKIDVYYQPPGGDTWRHVESAVARPRSAREVARALLAEADEVAARAVAAKAMAAKAAGRRNLTPLEIFERDMAAAMGAWGRYVEVEARRLWRGVGDAFDRDPKKQG